MAELELEKAYAPLDAMPLSLILIRNLCAFYALTMHFVCDPIDADGSTIHLACMRLAVESIDLVGIEAGVRVKPKDVPVSIREMCLSQMPDARIAKKLASVVAFDSYVDSCALPHLRRAQAHPLCGDYLRNRVLEDLVDRLE